MKSVYLLTIAAAAAGSLPAVAQTTPAPAPPTETRADVEAKVRERLGRLDADGNGTVSPEEMKAFADQRRKEGADESFAAMDIDKNGSISREEFDAWNKDRNFLNMPRIERFGGPNGKPWPKARVLRIERRAVDRAEEVAGGAADSASTQPPRTRVMMMGSDGEVTTNSDGKGIVIADAVKKALERFDSADTNKDGTLSLKEREARRAAWRASRS